jgi:Secretion system C-terminal sorting domain
MQKIITKISLAILLTVVVINLNAQSVLWPSSAPADTNQVKASKFTGGMNGWVTVGKQSLNPLQIDSCIWKWDIDSIYMRKGAYFNRTGFDNFSTSYADGYMGFNSDFLDNAGIRGNFNKGVCASTAANHHISELISPIIDLTGKNNFRVNFSQIFRKFTGTKTFVSWSEDGGTTWKPNREFNAELPVNDPPKNTPMSIPLVGSVGNNKIRIKFVIDANYYYWCVDDVKIVSIGNDMEINNTFFTIPTNLKIPKSQIEPIFFQADLINIGANNATNVKLRANIYDNSQKLVFTTEKNFGKLKPNDTLQNEFSILPKLWTPNSFKADYNGSYRIYQDSIDDIKTNDSVTFSMSITDTTFAKENGGLIVVQPGGFTLGVAKAWKWGNSYHISNPGWFRMSSTIGLINASSLKTKTVSTWLYKFLGDFNNIGRVDENERVRIMEGTFDVPASQPAGFAVFNTPMLDENEKKCIKLDTGNYLLMIEHTPNNIIGDSLLIAGTSVNYDATRLVSKSGFGLDRFTTVLGGFGTTPLAWSLAGFVDNLVPYARLNIIPTTSDIGGCKDIVSNNDILTDDNKLSIFPNPIATNDITVTIDITKLSKNASLEIYDITGKYMSGMKITNVKNNNYTMNVSDLANGTYFVKLTTEEGHKTVQFSVQK